MYLYVVSDSYTIEGVIYTYVIICKCLSYKHNNPNILSL